MNMKLHRVFFFVFVSVSLWSLDFFIRLLYDDLLFSECSENSSKFFFRLMKYVGHYDKLDSCSVLFFRIESDGTIPPERSQKKTQLARASTITGTIVDFWLLRLQNDFGHLVRVVFFWLHSW